MNALNKTFTEHNHPIENLVESMRSGSRFNFNESKTELISAADGRYELFHINTVKEYTDFNSSASKTRIQSVFLDLNASDEKKYLIRVFTDSESKIEFYYVSNFKLREILWFLEQNILVVSEKHRQEFPTDTELLIITVKRIENFTIEMLLNLESRMVIGKIGFIGLNNEHGTRALRRIRNFHDYWFGDKSSIFDILYKGGVPYEDDASIEECNFAQPGYMGDTTERNSPAGF